MALLIFMKISLVIKGGNIIFMCVYYFFFYFLKRLNNGKSQVIELLQSGRNPHQGERHRDRVGDK